MSKHKVCLDVKKYAQAYPLDIAEDLKGCKNLVQIDEQKNRKNFIITGYIIS